MTQFHTTDAGAPGGIDLWSYLEILRRRFFYLLIPAVAIFAAVYWYATKLPAVYQARATILVQSQLIPTSLAQSTVTAGANERIQTIQQRLMTRDNLLSVARKYELFADQPGLSPTDIVDRVRGATRIQQIDVGRAAQGSATAIGFTVSFDSSDPSAAAKVTNEFVSAILVQNVQARTQGAGQTSKFFDQQVVKLQTELAAQEARIADFKAQNQSALPETLSSRQGILLQLLDQANNFRSRVEALQYERQSLVAQGNVAATDGSIDGEIARLRLQLVQLRALYSDTHPEVRGVLAKIAALEGAVAAQPAAGSQGEKDKNAAGSGANPNARRIADIDRQLEQFDKQLAEIEQRTKALDASIQKTPEIEVALNTLSRDYDGLQAQYRSASAKAAEAATGQQLEEDRQAERFEVLESAAVPAEPISPDRRRIILAGGFGGLAAGAALVMLLETLDQSLRGAADVERRLRLRPLVTIPYIRTTHELRRGLLRRLALPLALLLAVVALAALVHTFYLPLDVLAQKVSQRIGL